jgi:hypothetical protein
MALKTIGMLTSYPDLTQYDWLWNQTPHPLGVWGRIQMLAQSPKPDFLLLYQYDFPAPKQRRRLSFLPRAKTSSPEVAASFRGVPKERIICLMREPPLPEVADRHQRRYAQAESYCGYVAGPEDFAPHPDYMPAIWYVNCPFEFLNTPNVPPKFKACSWITSGISRTQNHRKRLDFLQQVQANNLDCDIYGRDLLQGKGLLRNKWNGMAPYYYNLAVENFIDNDWYVSEKLWDALLSWCLPIYYGGPAAGKLLPEGSFLRLPSLDEKGIQYIQNVIATPDLWYERKALIAEARQIILHKLNLLNWLSEYVAS